MKVYIRSAKAKQKQCLATKIVDEQNIELFRVEYWDNSKASEAADKSIYDWLKYHAQYEVVQE